MGNPIRNAVVEIRKRDLVSCKRCGCPDLAWVKYKSGKSGLVQTAVQRPLWRGDSPAPEGLFALKFNFHRCEEYLATKAEIERRANMPHPKADNPREILSDAMSYLINQFTSEHPPQAWAALTSTDPLIIALNKLTKAQSAIQEVK